MNLRLIKRFRVAITLTAMACLILSTAGFKACTQDEKTRNIGFARDLNGAFIAAGPILAAKSQEFVTRFWNPGTALTAKVIDAVAASDSTQVAVLIKEILPIFTDAIHQFSNDQNLLIVLALGQIALNFFVNHYMKAVQAIAGALKGIDRTVEEFQALPQFGCQLRPERCR